MLIFNISIFLASIAMLFWSGSFLVGALTRIAKDLGWREFVVAFVVMAFAGSLPNLFVGISSALHKIPQLSFAEIVGGNLVDLTLAVALAALIGGGLTAKSRMVQTTATFTIAVAFLPLFLSVDGVLGRGDGIILILCFVFYVCWLFSKKERFTKVYNSEEKTLLQKGEKGFIRFVRDIVRVIFGMAVLLFAAEGIVYSASQFAQALNLSIVTVGILIVGFGNSLPELYFAVSSARKGQQWMVLGNLMGSVVVPATFVLGVTALIAPIKIIDFSPYVIARFFLILACAFFLIMIRSEQRIVKKEAIMILIVYLIFLLFEILI